MESRTNMHPERNLHYLFSSGRRTLPRMALGGIEFFQGVDPNQLEPFLRDCIVTELPAGDVLITAGEPNRHLYVLLEGALGVHLDSPQEPPLLHVEPGETVGELSLIDGKPSSAWVVAATECRVLVLDEELVWLLANTFHAVSSNLLFVLARRMRHGNGVIAEDRQQIREYQFQATIDGLTELFNRYWLDKMLPRAMERSRRSGEPLSLVMLDIDHFKRVNDLFGHPIGDEVIRRVSRNLRANIRALDLPARYGGEEFVLICPNTSKGAALNLAERLRAQIAGNPLDIGGLTVEVTISVGVAQMSSEDHVADLLGRSDEALYRAKDRGRNSVSD